MLTFRRGVAIVRGAPPCRSPVAPRPVHDQLHISCLKALVASTPTFTGLRSGNRNEAGYLELGLKDTSHDWKKDCGKPGCRNDHGSLGARP